MHIQLIRRGWALAYEIDGLAAVQSSVLPLDRLESYLGLDDGVVGSCQGAVVSHGLQGSAARLHDARRVLVPLDAGRGIRVAYAPQRDEAGRVLQGGRQHAGTRLEAHDGRVCEIGLLRVIRMLNFRFLRGSFFFFLFEV